jgi:hypothetical protein
LFQPPCEGRAIRGRKVSAGSILLTALWADRRVGGAG